MGSALSDTAQLFQDRPPQAAEFRSRVCQTPVPGLGPVPHGDLSSPPWPDRVTSLPRHLVEGRPARPTADGPPLVAKVRLPRATMTPAQYVRGTGLPFHRSPHVISHWEAVLLLLVLEHLALFEHELLFEHLVPITPWRRGNPAFSKPGTNTEVSLILQESIQSGI